MAIYNKYTARNKVCWKVEGYLGVNPLTGKKKKFKKQGFATKKEAIQAFNNAKYQFDQGNYITNNSNFKFEQVYQEWFSNVYVDNVKESTANKTEQHFRLHILPALGELFIKKITPNLIQKQINIWHKKFAMYKKLGSHTLNVFDYAFAHGYIKDNPRNKVILNKKKLDYDSQEKKRKYYTKEEVHTLLNYLKNSDSGQWFPFFRLLAYSVMRKGEALALTWKDIDFNNNRITVNKTLTYGKITS